MKRKLGERGQPGARRFHPEAEALEQRLAPAFSGTDVLVQFEPGFDPRAALPGGARVLEQLPLVPNLNVVSLPPGWNVPQMLNGISHNPHVLLAQPDYELNASQVPNDLR